MGLDQLAHLLLRESQRFFEKPAVRFKDELNHACTDFSSRVVASRRPGASGVRSARAYML